MTIITDTNTLKDYCSRLSTAEFFAIDTEFLRNKTYYPKLCLIQMALPGEDPVAVDPLESKIDLQPLYEVLANENVLKVFHAARQDLEIFYQEMGSVPAPIFDTQVAAMVSGYGDQIGYHNLVNRICNYNIDKGPQYTDWSRRPLSDKQLSYALGDVTHLRDVYLSLSKELEERGRLDWGRQEMRILCADQTYAHADDLAWQRIKLRTDQPKVLSVLKEIAAWRESEAKNKDVPRNRIIRDESLADIAIHPPQSIAELSKMRGVSKDFAEGRYGKNILECVKKGLAVPKDEAPKRKKQQPFPRELQPVLEMLKMLLRIQASEHDVAAKLISDTSDLQALAVDDNADIPAMRGWRYEIFGQEAIALKRGELKLSLKNNEIVKS